MTEVEGPSVDGRLLAALYLLEAAAVVLVLALYKYSDRFISLTPRQELILLAPAVTLAACGGYVTRRYLRAAREGTRRFTFTAALNLVVVCILLIAGETAVRVFSVSTPLGLRFAGTLLQPRSWEDVKARNAALLAHAPANISYFVSDTLLGWTVGPSRRSADGLYLSSAEGIRTGRAGVAYADRPAGHSVAIVGDSYTFGLEVPFEDAWASRLEHSLGAGFRVLDFGVDGYGVDQAYLRYGRDVPRWHPAVTIFGFIDDDLHRSLYVYTFVSRPEWGFPFSKPRFKLLHYGELRLLNVPLINPSAILERRTVADLPFIEYDPGYHAEDWQWHAYDASYLIRYVMSRFPRVPAVTPGEGEDAEIEINATLLRRFAQRAVHDGTVPIIVYFPSRGDFSGQDRSTKDGVLRILGGAGIRYFDLTACIRAVDPARAFLPGRPHYSPVGNAAVARCLLPVVREQLPP